MTLPRNRGVDHTHEYLMSAEEATGWNQAKMLPWHGRKSCLEEDWLYGYDSHGFFLLS